MVSCPENIFKINLILPYHILQATMNTGKNRDPKDQFYTDKNVSVHCINMMLETVNASKDDLFIEPSAGDGSFSDYLKNTYKTHAYDIDPKKRYIKTQDFLELDIGGFISDSRRIHSIGNPPFGRQSSLARKFINKCALFSDTISFILPKSFRKSSYQSSFPLRFHLEKEYELDKDAFVIDGKTHDVPCVFQIWVKKDIDRYIEPKPIAVGFKFVKQPTLEDIEFNSKGSPIERKNVFQEAPDFGILRAGGGKKCGRISMQVNNGIKCYPQGWLFIKLDNKYDVDEFYTKYLHIDWTDDSNVGARSICKPVFIKKINELLQSIN